MACGGVYIIPRNNQIAFRLAILGIFERLVCFAILVISFVLFAYLTDKIDGLSLIFADQNAMFRGGFLMWFISSAFFIVWIMGCGDLVFLVAGTFLFASHAAGLVDSGCTKIDDLIRAEKITGHTFLAVFIFCLGIIIACFYFDQAGFTDYIVCGSAFIGTPALVGSSLYIIFRFIILATIVSGLVFTNVQAEAPTAKSCAAVNSMSSIPAVKMLGFSSDELYFGSERGRLITVMGAHVLGDAGREGVSYVARGLGSSVAAPFRLATRGAFRGMARNLKFLADQGKHLMSMGIDSTRGRAASQGKKLWRGGCTSAV